MRRKIHKLMLAFIIIASTLFLLGFGLDNRLQTTEYNVYDTRVPAAFEGFKIAQLSDMHCLWFGEGQSDLISAVRSGEPNIIVLTGDIIDANNQDFESVAALFDGLNDIVPVYAVSGNHEIDTRGVPAKMESLYAEYGINFIDDSGVSVSFEGADIFLYGVMDRPTGNFADYAADIPILDKNTYGILLYHRSNNFDYLSNLGYGLVFSGHGHGGLIRLPFVGGIVAPEGRLDFNQKYTGGMYTVGNTTLISNRGLAGSHNVPRIFNRSEVVFVTLHHTP